MGTDRLIYIRTDGNSRIASGHLVRCFSIAQACNRLDMKVCFLVSDEESASVLRKILCEGNTSDWFEEKFQIRRLKTAAYDNLEQELPELLSLLSFNCNAPSCLSAEIIYLADSYYVTPKYLTALRPYAKVAYLDDLQLFDYPVDLLINYDIIPDSAMPFYKAAYRNANQLLLGASYTPLRSQFQNRKITVKERVNNILITTGGSDPYHFCLNLVQHLCGLVDRNAISFDKNLHIVIGKLNTDKDALCQLAEKYSFLQLHENVSDMASLMERCDLAVSASGTTLYELCALGIPTISFTMADNQLTAAKAFDDAGAIPCAGDIRMEEEKILKAIADLITQMPQSYGDSDMKCSYETRKSIHKAMRRLVDGKGAMRIADALMQL